MLRADQVVELNARGPLLRAALGRGWRAIFFQSGFEH